MIYLLRKLTYHIPELPAHTWCPHIEPSKFEPGTAFAVFDDHLSMFRSNVDAAGQFSWPRIGETYRCVYRSVLQEAEGA